ncbi:hypothetical protein BAMA111019_16330 [Bacillus manliponensis]
MKEYIDVVWKGSTAIFGAFFGFVFGGGVESIVTGFNVRIDY